MHLKVATKYLQTSLGRSAQLNWIVPNLPRSSTVYTVKANLYENFFHIECANTKKVIPFFAEKKMSYIGSRYAYFLWNLDVSGWGRNFQGTDPTGTSRPTSGQLREFHMLPPIHNKCRSFELISVQNCDIMDWNFDMLVVAGGCGEGVKADVAAATVAVF